MYVKNDSGEYKVYRFKAFLKFNIKFTKYENRRIKILKCKLVGIVSSK